MGCVGKNGMYVCITTYDCRLQTTMAVLAGSTGRGSGAHPFLTTASLKKTKELSSLPPRRWVTTEEQRLKAFLSLNRTIAVEDHGVETHGMGAGEQIKVSLGHSRG
jgi:hypothetical protein